MKKEETSALRSWKELNAQLAQLPEEEVGRLLELERANKRRPMVLRRLHQRLTKLRTTREREDLRTKP